MSTILPMWAFLVVIWVVEAAETCIWCLWWPAPLRVAVRAELWWYGVRWRWSCSWMCSLLHGIGYYLATLRVIACSTAKDDLTCGWYTPVGLARWLHLVKCAFMPYGLYRCWHVAKMLHNRNVGKDKKPENQTTDVGIDTRQKTRASLEIIHIQQLILMLWLVLMELNLRLPTLTNLTMWMLKLRSTQNMSM